VAKNQTQPAHVSAKVARLCARVGAFGQGPTRTAGLAVEVLKRPRVGPLGVAVGAGGLGGEIFAQITFKSNVVVAGVLCLALAIAFDVLLLLGQRLLTPWRRAGIVEAAAR